MPNVRIRIEKENVDVGEANIGQKSASDEKKQVAVASVFAHQMMGLGKQIVSYGANNVGSFTGNYIIQDEINATLDIVGDISTIALGFAVNPVAGAFAVVGVATKKTLEAITNRRNDIRSEREREYLVARSGNATTNGSRGTEN